MTPHLSWKYPPANHRAVTAALTLLGLFPPAAPAAAMQLQIQAHQNNVFLQAFGRPDDEWRFQTSASLTSWTNAPALGTVFSSPDNPRSVPAGSARGSLYRAVRTTGLYDPAVRRTMELTFSQSNWPQILATNYSTGSNLLANLTVDGTNYPGVGVRYRGSSSYSRSGIKKSLNISVDYTFAGQRVRGYKTLNLNNGWEDPSLMREALYLQAVQEYTPGPKASFARLTINGEFWGVYSLVQQENGDLINEWFPSNDGDRWKAPSGTGSTDGSPLSPPAASLTGGEHALKYLGTNLANYQPFYELRTRNSPDPWQRLYHAIDVLNNSPTNGLLDRLEEVLAVDRWIWFLALENAFTDPDSYWGKGADYQFYWEPESGRLHPIEHDGNEVLRFAEVQLSPFQHTGNTNRPVIHRLLNIPELRQRYLAHLRTLLEERLNPGFMDPRIDEHAALLVPDLERDAKKGYAMPVFTNDVAGLRNFIRQRYDWLRAQPEVQPVGPTVAVSMPTPTPPNEQALVTATVRPVANDGIDSVWLHYRAGPSGRFSRRQMFDDGTHRDGAPGDGVFGAETPVFPAGTTVHYYVEARSANAPRTTTFEPPQAEQRTFSYQVVSPG